MVREICKRWVFLQLATTPLLCIVCMAAGATREWSVMLCIGAGCAMSICLTVGYSIRFTSQIESSILQDMARFRRRSASKIEVTRVMSPPSGRRVADLERITPGRN